MTLDEQGVIRTRTILIVDDEKKMRMRFKKALKDEGYKAIEASSALAVADTLMKKGSDLDLILLDINIPYLDGREIFDIIDQYAPNMPIIVTSVHPIMDQRLKIPRATDYYQKLHKIETLLGKVKSALGISARK